MTVLAWPRMLDPDMAMEYAGGEKIFKDLIKKKLLVARCQGRGLTRYDRVELDNALDQWKGFGPDSESGGK